MFKKLFAALALIFVVGLGVFGYSLWSASKGVAPATLEAKYVSANDRFVMVDGARVRIRLEGPTGAPVVLLVHGFTHSLETWDAWAAALSENYRVIRYDLLGHGLTGPDPKKRYAPAERAEFVGDVMDALGVERAFVAGNSLGGLAAWRFAAAYPDRVAGLILISPGAFPLNGVSDEPAEIPAAMKAYLLTAPEAGVRASAQIIYADDSKITDARIDVMRDMIRRRGNGEAMIASLEEFTLPDPTALLATITAPTVVLWGEGDIVVPTAQGAQFVAALPGARLITYPGVGHAAQEEAPDETVRDAGAFIATVLAAQAGAQ